jgi:hypothetical protein
LQLGIGDPEQWLELQPDRVLAYWEAFDQRRPIGFEWEQYANVMAMLEVLVASTTNPNLEEKNRIKPRGMEAFLPPGLQEKKKKKGMLHKQLQLLARVFGGSYGDDNR